MSEQKLIADMGNAIYKVLREYKKEPKDVRVVLDVHEIRILVKLNEA